MKHYQTQTMTELYNAMIDGLIWGKANELGYVSSVDVAEHTVIGEAEHMDWDFDLKSSWLTKQRWSMLVRQYIDPQDLETWIGRITSRIGTKERGIAVMRTKTVKPRGGEATGHSNKQTRIWGACMLSFSYTAKPRPTITLHSRTSYMGYIGGLDMTVAYVIGKYLAQELGIAVTDIRFVWMVEATQWHFFKSMSYMLTNPDPEKAALFKRLLLADSSELTREEKRMVIDHPGIKGSRKWLRKVVAEDAAGRTYGDLTYNTFRRVIRRYHTEVHGLEYAQQFEGWEYAKRDTTIKGKALKAGDEKEFFKAYAPLPSVHADELDFSPIKMPITRRYGEPFMDSGEDFDDDDDE